MVNFTRRRLLASAGLGALALGTGASAATGTRPAYARYTYAQTTDPADEARVTVAWQEWYNGRALETQGGAGGGDANATLDPAVGPTYVPDRNGPVVALPNVLPGDRGRFAVGVDVASLPAGEDGLELWTALSVTENAENGLVEPERAAGDAAGNGGELADALSVTVWADVGVGGVGACDGRRTGGDLGLEPALADGSLRDAEDALAGGVRLADGCLDAGETRCLGLAWSLPASVGNAVQSDRVAFDLSVAAVSCGSGNPFAGSESTGGGA